MFYQEGTEPERVKGFIIKLSRETALNTSDSFYQWHSCGNQDSSVGIAVGWMVRV
jgi:hypothetical protein